jgi:Fasciclin domain/VHL beta domain
LTVFAPTDDAFAKLPHGTVEDLLKPENKEKLATILKYHVVAGKVAAKDAVKVESAKTLSGEAVRISIRDGRLAVNNANVIVNDVEASNGIVHVIDTVLLPPEKPTSFKIGSDVELLKRIDPKFEPSLKSVDDDTEVSIAFCNLSPRPIQACWIRFNGERKAGRGLIEPGNVAVCEKTHENHVWLIADERGTTLGLYVVGEKNAIIVNTQ